jgi:lysozyme
VAGIGKGDIHSLKRLLKALGSPKSGFKLGNIKRDSNTAKRAWDKCRNLNLGPALKDPISKLVYLTDNAVAGDLQTKIKEYDQKFYEAHGFLDKTRKGAIDHAKALTELSRKISGDILRNPSERFAKRSKEFEEGLLEFSSALAETYTDNAFSLDSQQAAQFQVLIQEAYREYQEAMSIAVSVGLDSGRELSAKEATLYNYVEVKMLTAKSILDSGKGSLKETTEVTTQFLDEVDKRTSGMFASGQMALDHVSSITSTMKSFDFKGASQAIRSAAKDYKSNKNPKKGADNYSQGMQKVSKTVSNLAKLTLVFEVIKGVVGAWAKLSDKISEFNGQLLGYHSLTSLDITPEMSSSNIKEALNHYRKLFNDFGHDTGTYVAPADLFKLTSVFESAGLELADISSSKESFERVMLTTLKVANNSTMSTGEVAAILSEWHEQLGMNIYKIDGLLSSFVKAEQHTDIPASFYLNTLKKANLELLQWNDAALTVLDIQREATKDDSVFKVGTDVTETLFKIAGNIKLPKWHYMFNNIPKDVLTEIIGDDYKRILKSKESAKTEVEMQNAEYALGLIKNLKAADFDRDSLGFTEKFVSIASPKARIRVLQEGLRSLVIDPYKVDVKGTYLALPPEIENQIMTILEVHNADAETRVHVYKILMMMFEGSQGSFLKNLRSKDIEKSKSDVAREDKIHMGYLEQTTKHSDMLGAVIEKYMSRVLGYLQGTLFHLGEYLGFKKKDIQKRPYYQRKRYGGILGQAVVGASNATSPSSKKLWLKKVATAARNYAHWGGDVTARAEKYKKMGAPKDVLAVILAQKKYYRDPNSSKSSGKKSGGGGPVVGPKLPPASTDLFEYIKSKEGLRLKAYQDPSPKKIWTIGYGQTGSVDGKAIGRGMVITTQKAEELLRNHINMVQRQLVSALPNIKLNKNQLNALTSFVYNIGITQFKGSRVFRLLKAGDYQGAAQALGTTFNTSYGKRLQGLVTRRLHEQRWFSLPVEGSSKKRGLVPNPISAPIPRQPVVGGGYAPQVTSPTQPISYRGAMLPGKIGATTEAQIAAQVQKDKKDKKRSANMPPVVYNSNINSLPDDIKTISYIMGA